MTRKRLFIQTILLAATLLISACSSLPTIEQNVSDAAVMTANRCDAVFPCGKWQFVHAIEASLPGGRKNVVLGISTISSQNRFARSLILTVEGMVLFDAQYETQLRINRAVPPFDSKNFARGLMEDIRFIFFAPRGPVTASGRLKDGADVCRYRLAGGGFTDIILTSPDSWELRRYSPGGRLTSRVQASGIDDIHGQRIPRHLALQARAADGKEYQLNLKLVEAVPR